MILCTDNNNDDNTCIKIDATTADRLDKTLDSVEKTLKSAGSSKVKLYCIKYTEYYWD